MTQKRTVATHSLPRRRTTVFSLAADGSAAEVDGYIVIQIGDEKFTLVGKVGAAIYVAYHKPFEEAFPLGTIPQMLGKVATALGIPNAADFEKSLNDTLAQLAAIPALGKVVEVLSKGVFKITDLGIDTRNPDSKSYEFGFGVDTSETVDSIPLAAFGLKFTYTSTKPPS
jgi:hypothetical protein